jgi:hypothetical protein
LLILAYIRIDNLIECSNQYYHYSNYLGGFMNDVYLGRVAQARNHDSEGRNPMVNGLSFFNRRRRHLGLSGLSSTVASLTSGSNKACSRWRDSDPVAEF